MKKIYLTFIILIVLLHSPVNLLSQKTQKTYQVSGELIDINTRKPLAFAVVLLYKSGEKTNYYSITDTLGRFTISNVPYGIYKIQASLLGYKNFMTEEFKTSPKGNFISVEMEVDSQTLKGVVFTAKKTPFRKTNESPLSRINIGTLIIEKSPGANRDVSKVIYSLPGVSGVNGASSWRNDLLVRGGGPTENKFYMDGIEIPAINHFSTQGASGGPVGMINADFIREVNFYTGAFPVSMSNALSSVMDIRLKDGSLNSQNFVASLGASEVSFSADGHFDDRTTYLFSARTSYLQFLFKLLNLPFLPTFTDAQFKIKTRFNRQHELTVLGLVGIDDLKLNDDDGGKESNAYILSYLPSIKQEVFTVGAAYKYYYDKGNVGVYLSHSFLNNRNLKYAYNDDSSEDNLNLKYRSIESETKLRVENIHRFKWLELKTGIGLELPYYTNSTQQRFTDVLTEYSTSLLFLKYSAFGNLSYTSPSENFLASLSLRMDGASYSKSMANPLKQLSPKLSLSYQFYPAFFLNFSVSRVFQLPSYTTLGFKNMEGILVNKENGIKYLGNNNIALGLEYKPFTNLKVSVEGFFKHYFDGMLSERSQTPADANSVDFGVTGNQAVLSELKGLAYGVEVGARWFLGSKLSTLLSYTYFRSSYYSPEKYDSSWDNQHLFTFAGTYNFKYNYSVGLKLRYSGGAPYTPYNEDVSSLKLYWDAVGRGLPDYDKFNSLRLKGFTQLDIRADKTFSFKKWAFSVYIDIQNILNLKYRSPDVIVSTGEIINPEAPLPEQRYKMKYLKMEAGTILPTIGLMFMF